MKLKLKVMGAKSFKQLTNIYIYIYMWIKRWEEKWKKTNGEKLGFFGGGGHQIRFMCLREGGGGGA